jgi:urease accessory protein UreF
MTQPTGLKGESRGVNRRTERLARIATGTKFEPVYTKVGWYALVAACQQIAGKQDWLALYGQVLTAHAADGTKLARRDTSEGVSLLAGWQDELKRIWRENPPTS